MRAVRSCNIWLVSFSKLLSNYQPCSDYHAFFKKIFPLFFPKTNKKVGLLLAIPILMNGVELCALVSLDTRTNQIRVSFLNGYYPGSEMFSMQELYLPF